MQEAEFIWFDGELIPWADAKIHVLSHVVHYGSGVFEGMRAYATPSGPCVVGMKPHVERLFFSAKVVGLKLRHTPDEIEAAIAELIRRNQLSSAYIRPLVFRGYGSLGVLPRGGEIQTIIAAFPWGTLHGDGAIENGIDVAFSSWRRMAPSTHPSMAKATGNYLNSMLVAEEAQANGFDEGLVLDVGGTLSEGSGENVFLVSKGVIWTPPIGNSILAGITRAMVIELAQDFGYAVREQTLAREMAYACEEMFLTGTACEITPVRSVDRRPVGAGEVGEVTRRLQESFFGILNGELEDRFGWLTPV